MKLISLLFCLLLQPPSGVGPGGGNGNGHDPCVGPHPPPSCEGPSVPIEGENFLIAAGVALYLYRIMQKKKIKRLYRVLFFLRSHSNDHKNESDTKESNSNSTV
jgi:hypothetical protein